MSVMRRLFRAGLLSAGLILGADSPGAAQPVHPTMPKQEAPQAEEPKRVEQSGPTPVVPYTLAGIGTIIVMVLICMPARRE